MSAAETISLVRAHCEANDKRERATFSIASIRELLAFVDDCAATIKPFPPLPSREVSGKASMSRELLGAVVDDVFDGAIEDPSVIEDIYASIKRHEGALSTNAEPVGEPLELPYKNWRGEISTRKLQPIRLEFGATEWHPEPQWLLVATDIEKNVERSFALKDFNPHPITEVEEELEAELTHFFVKALSGHTVRLIRNAGTPDAETLQGISVGTHRSFAIRDILEIFRKHHSEEMQSHE